MKAIVRRRLKLANRFWGVVLCGLCSIVSCTPRAVAALPGLTGDQISGASLWQRITVEEDFKAYPSWPDYKGIQPGQSPHGRFHRIYINPILADALPISANIAPAGSIIIKENYDPDRVVSGYTVMAKVPGYNPDAGDWFWAAYDNQGGVKMEGRPAMCIRCHSSSASDFVLLQRLDAAGADQ